MGHYASEMADDRPPRDDGSVSGYANDEKIKKFFGVEFTNSQNCPICGASVQWDWTRANNLLLHIDWHEELRRCINAGFAYPGNKI